MFSVVAVASAPQTTVTKYEYCLPILALRKGKAKKWIRDKPNVPFSLFAVPQLTNKQMEDLYSAEHDA